MAGGIFRSPVELDDGTFISPVQSNKQFDDLSSVLDKQWVRNSFLVSDAFFDENTADVANRYWSNARAKFTDTRMGCNFGINPRPQPCMYSDRPVKDRLGGRNDVSPGIVMGNYGMSRQYSEMIDEPARRIMLTFGVPQFSGLLGFLSRAFNAEQMTLARTGRGSSLFYQAFKVVGTAATTFTFPAIALTIVTAKTATAFFSKPSNSYYTVKNTMHLYWSTANSLLAAMAVNRGIMPKILSKNYTQKLGRPFQLDDAYLSQMSDLMPDIFHKSHFFDLYSAATKAQRLANQTMLEEMSKLDNETATNFEGYVYDEMRSTGTKQTIYTNAAGETRLQMLMAKFALKGYWQSVYGQDGKDATGAESDPRDFEFDKENATTANPGNIGDVEGQKSISDYFDSLLNDGAMFATFIVDDTGPITDSFSNAYGESGISQSLNNLAAGASQVRFGTSDGNIAGGNAVGDFVQGLASTVKDVALGTIDGVTLGASEFLRGLAGSGFIDIPKHWQGSSASIARTSYTIQLVAPYGNPLALLMGLDVPIAMLLAGSLPRSVGGAAYASPFLCQLYDRGRCQIRTGMIESITFTRGTGNLSFNDNHAPLAVDVTIVVADFSNVAHMLVPSGNLLDDINPLSGGSITVSEDNILMDYLAVLVGQDIYSQIYPFSKSRLNFAKKVMSLNKYASPAFQAAALHNSLTSGFLSSITLGATRMAVSALEGVSRGIDPEFM